MPYKAIIRYVAARPFRYAGEALLRGHEVHFQGERNDRRLIDSPMVRTEVLYECRAARCRRRFPDVASLLAHEKDHEGGITEPQWAQADSE